MKNKQLRSHFTDGSRGAPSPLLICGLFYFGARAGSYSYSCQGGVFWFPLLFACVPYLEGE